MLIRVKSFEYIRDFRFCQRDLSVKETLIIRITCTNKKMTKFNHLCTHTVTADYI